MDHEELEIDDVGRVKNLIINMFTEHNDTESFCAAKVCTVIGSLVYLMIAVIQVVKTGNINFSDLGTGFGFILGGGGAAIGIKQYTSKI